MTATFEYLASEQVIFQIDGADLLAPLVERAEAAAASAEDAVDDATAQAGIAAAAAATAAQSGIALKGDILADGANHPNYSAMGSWPAQNRDGTYTATGAAGGGMSRTYAATGLLAAGNAVALSAKIKTGAFAAGRPQITFQPSGTIAVCAAPDANGVARTVATTIPGGTTSIVVNAPSNANGDKMWIALVPSAISQGAEQYATGSASVFTTAAPQVGAQMRVVARGQSVQVIHDMNGTAAMFEVALLSRGVTPFSATLVAAKMVEEAIRSAGLLSRLDYFNMFWGADDWLALRTPFLSKGYLDLDNVRTALLGSASEAAGLPAGLNANFDTGIIPGMLGETQFGFGGVVYGMNDQATDIAFPVWGEPITGQLGFYPRYVNLHIFDRGNGGGTGRVQVSAAGGSYAATTYTTKGPLGFLSDRGGVGRIFKAGVELGNDVRGPAGTEAAWNNPLVINPQYLGVGGIAFGHGFNPGDIATLGYIMHDARKMIGSAVTNVEGLY
ncbi:hypothetical protein [Sphingomonas immobilis]|uniref:DUF2793 domain-containing protein n=1 Tax=Sphingomonas immobilis TaxID=3063997 RepID=A0ABT9A0V1_9SPHN|nr:hypothetical protein [Sphingomonas sp. CA1-15]MDO7843464.1 hypothetical protein [Sphingomonas sp. CA1-15]